MHERMARWQARPLHIHSIHRFCRPAVASIYGALKVRLEHMLQRLRVPQTGKGGKTIKALQQCIYIFMQMAIVGMSEKSPLCRCGWSTCCSG